MNALYSMIIVLLVSFSSIIACSEINAVFYYRHIDFAGIHNIKLKYPIRPDESKSDYCFRIAFDNKGRIISLKFPTVGGQGNDPGGQYSTISILYSKEQERWSYFNSKGLPTANEKGVYTELYKLNHQGFPISLINFNAHGKIIEDSSGVAVYILTPNKNGLISICERLNLQDRKIIDHDGHCTSHYDYDNNGHLIKKANYDLNGNLLDASDGIAITVYKYDSFGNYSQESFFDSNNRLKINAKLGAAIIRLSYDINGNPIEARLYDASDRLAVGFASFPIIKTIFGENGRPSEYKYCGGNDIPLEIMKFTPEGSISSVKYYDLNGNLIIDSIEGYAEYRSKFDSHQNLIEESYSDDKMKLIISPKIGFAIARYEYNGHNDRTKCSWYDTNEQLLENQQLSCAIVTYEYDYPNGVITMTCRDVHNLLKECKYGYAIKKSKYDNTGKLLDEKYFSKSGSPITNAHFDKDGRRID